MDIRFVDSSDGLGARLAAAVASRAGLKAQAFTTGVVADTPDWLVAIAEETGLELSGCESLQGDALADGTRWVWLGTDAPAGAEAWPLELYSGPDATAFGAATLERDANARILRDRVAQSLGQLDTDSLF